MNLIYSYLTSVAADTWPFVQGALFIAVVLARPDGLISLKKDFHWYRQALKGYLNFKGRSGRQEFWYFSVFHLVFVLLLTAAAMLVDPKGFTQIFTGGASHRMGFQQCWDANSTCIDHTGPALVCL